MKHLRSFHYRSALIVFIGVMASACDLTTPEEPGEEARLKSVSQATYGGDLLRSFGKPIATGATLGTNKTNEVSPSCDVSSSHSAPDVSYIWTVPFTDSFTIDTLGSDFNTILVVRQYQGSVQLACNDNASSSTTQSSLTLSLTIGTTYLITVDGVGSHTGNYRLNIDSVSCPGGCPLPESCVDSTYCNTDEDHCVPTSTEAGAACDDDNLCTTNDVCNGSGGCGGTTKVCNTPPSQCHEASGSCNPSTGDCNYAPKAAGVACNDGNACTTNDVCNGSGGCGGAAKVCNTPPGQCHLAAGSCNPSTGGCDYMTKPRYTDCNDGNLCTIGDACDSWGNCRGTYKCHGSSSACMIETGCNTSTGECTFAPRPSGTSCDDQQACTGNDACDGAGNCKGGALNCGRYPCTIASCDEQGLCQYESACMETQICFNGRCAHDKF